MFYCNRRAIGLAFLKNCPFWPRWNPVLATLVMLTWNEWVPFIYRGLFYTVLHVNHSLVGFHVIWLSSEFIKIILKQQRRKNNNDSETFDFYPADFYMLITKSLVQQQFFKVFPYLYMADCLFKLNEIITSSNILVNAMFSIPKASFVIPQIKIEPAVDSSWSAWLLSNTYHLYCAAQNF